MQPRAVPPIDDSLARFVRAVGVVGVMHRQERNIMDAGGQRGDVRCRTTGRRVVGRGGGVGPHGCVARTRAGRRRGPDRGRSRPSVRGISCVQPVGPALPQGPPPWRPANGQRWHAPVRARARRPAPPVRIRRWWSVPRQGTGFGLVVARQIEGDDSKTCCRQRLDEHPQVRSAPTPAVPGARSGQPAVRCPRSSAADPSLYPLQ